MKNLNSERDVERALNQLRTISVPETIEADFLALVWDKVAAQHTPLSIPKPSPAFALSAAAALLVISALWAFQNFALIPTKTLPPHREIAVKGVILEARGLANGASLATELALGEPAPILKAIEEGDRMTTTGDSHVTFYFPEAGYLYLGENSSLLIKTARKELLGGHARYEVVLERGTLYSRLEELENGSVFRYATPYGRARVIGTDFVLDVIPPPAFGPEGWLSSKAPPSAEKAGGGMLVEVLDGVVAVEALERPVEFENVERGQRAVISTYAAGVIEMSAVPPERMGELENAFDRLFQGIVRGRGEEHDAQAPSFRILENREE